MRRTEGKKPKILILDKHESPTGVFVRFETDYGVKTQLNFTKPISDEEINRALKDFYENHKPEAQKILRIKRGDRIDWEE